MTNTATHDGTCQACGRQHAVNPKTGNLAKHGYTVDWGFFNGTCSGSDKQPLEIDTAHNVAIVEALYQRAADLEKRAAGEITEVQVDVGRELVNGKAVRKYRWVDRAEFEATQPRWAKFDEAANARRAALQRQASHLCAHAAELSHLRETRHGQPLIARAIEAEIKREHYKTYREAYARVEELKAAGHKAQQRREKWNRTYTVTYR